MLSRLYWEWKLATADPAFAITINVIAILTLVAFFSGWQPKQMRQQRIDELATQNATTRQLLASAFSPEDSLEQVVGHPLKGMELTQAQSLRMSARSPDLLAHLDGVWWTWFSPDSLTALAVGESNEWPDRYRLHPQSLSETLYRDVQLNPYHAFAGSFDLTLLVAAILPLAVIILTHDILSADRESGILALIHSQRTSLTRLLLVRCLIRALGLSLVVAVVTLAGLIFAGADPFEMQFLSRFGLWTLSLGLYASCWGFLILALNAFGASSTANTILLLLCWTGMILLVPFAVGEVVGRHHPLPSQAELAAAEIKYFEIANFTADEIVAEEKRLHPENIPAEKEEQRMQVLRYLLINETARRWTQKKVQQDLDVISARDAELTGWSWVSPVVAWRQSASQLAGTSLWHYVRFTRMTAQFQSEYLAYFRAMSLEDRELSGQEVRRIPQFHDCGLGGQLDSGQLGTTLGALLAWNIGLCLIGCIRLQFPCAIK